MSLKIKALDYILKINARNVFYGFRILQWVGGDINQVRIQIATEYT